MEPNSPPSAPDPQLTEQQQIDQILLLHNVEERKSGATYLWKQFWIACAISLLFYALTWIKFGMDWANVSGSSAICYLVPIAIGNPWKWLWHHNDPNFSISTTSRVISWALLLLTVLFCYFWSPGNLTSMVRGVDDVTTGNPTVNQLQQLNGELNQ